MNSRIKLLSTLFFLSTSSFLFNACNQSENKTATNKHEDVESSSTIIEHLDADQIKVILESEKVNVVDVRTPEEYSAGHIEGAININFYDNDFESQIEKLDTELKTIVYCAVGGRSSASLYKFKTKGFKHVVELNGGFDVW